MRLQPTRRSRAHGMLLVLALTASTLIAMAAPAAAISGTQPVLVVLCNFSNQTQQPRPVSFFEDMYGAAGAGDLGAFDYWKDVSYGNLDVTGTEVKGWYTLPITRDTWVGYDRGQKWQSCAQAADPDVDYTRFEGVIAIFPEAVTTTAAAIDASATSVQVSSLTTGNAANFPTPPFNTLIMDPAGTSETVRVTAISGTTMTIARAQGGSTAIAHPSGATVQVNGDLFGFNPVPVTINGTNYTLGGALGAHDIPLSVMAHEQGHLFAFNHSRSLSQAPSDYSDCYDLMSTLSCAYSFTSSGGDTGIAFGGSSFGGTGKGPGLNSIQVDANGWLPSARKATFDNSSCNQTTYTMAALNHPEVSGFQQVRVPAARPIPAAGGSTINSDYYSVELRSKSGWDRGIPADAFVLHLKGSDGNSYLVDRDAVGLGVGALGDGALRAANRYVDTARNTYIAVNRITPEAFTGQVTIGGCRIGAHIGYTGDTSIVYRRVASFSADLLVDGSNAPVPNVPLQFTLGTQSCTARTDASGRATCGFRVTQPAGTSNVEVSFAGDSAYAPVSLATPFTIERAATTLEYTGPTVLLQGGGAVTLSARLLEDGLRPTVPSGQTVTLSVGTESCTGTTDATGVASCAVSLTGPLGELPLSATFAGDEYYLPSADTGAQAIVFAFPARGAFVLGDDSVSDPGADPMTWWSATWSKENRLSTGPAAAAFKGFADTATLADSSAPGSCAGTWSGRGGNAALPAPTVPSYMGVVVTSDAVKAPGSTVQGTQTSIVVVRTDGGYGPHPGAIGTGTIVATYC